jgi:hypothetical protein
VDRKTAFNVELLITDVTFENFIMLNMFFVEMPFCVFHQTKGFFAMKAADSAVVQGREFRCRQSQRVLHSDLSALKVIGSEKFNTF